MNRAALWVKPEGLVMALAGGAPGGVHVRSSAPVPRNVVLRPRLFEQLDACLTVAVTVVCAPAGYGKTLLVADWARAHSEFPIAWVGLRRYVDGSAGFWSTLIGELKESLRDLKLDALPVRTGLDTPGLPVGLTRWAGTLEQDTVVVVDDFHAVVDAALHEQLVEFVGTAGPRLHLVLLTRHDPPWPLHRMRLDGGLRELRTDDLAFTGGEAVELFATNQITITPAVADRLVERTAGWAAALRLAALGASRTTDPPGFLAEVSGRTGYIADYLMREVWESLDPEWRTFLTRTCVVDEVCAELAVALGAVDHADHADHRLVESARSNTLIHEIGNRPGWYRLHPLLLDFLRSRATDRFEQRRLHRSAAGWFLGQGLPDAALTHALAGHQWAIAGDLVGTHVVTWTVCRPPTELGRRLEAVPEEVALSQPGIAIGIAAARMMAGRTEGVDEYVRAAEDHLAAVGGRRRRRYQFVLDCLRIGHHRWQGDLAEMLRQSQLVPSDPSFLGDLGLADWAAMRTLVMSNIGSAELWTGDRSAAREHLGIAADEPLGDGVVLPILNARSHLAYLLWEDGDLNGAHRLGNRAAESFARFGMAALPQASCAYLALVRVAIDRDELDEAAGWLDAAVRSTVEPHATLALRIAEARLHQARGRRYQAAETIRAARAGLGGASIPQLLVDDLTDLESPEICCGSRTTVESAVAAALQAVVAADQQSAQDHLDRALRAAADHHFRRPFLEVGAELRPLLERQVHADVGYAAFVVDLLSRTANRSARSSGARTPYAPLTEREDNILRYLATPLTTREIAEALYVSVNTVKSHQRSIYLKLGVNARRDAVQHAKQLHLL